MCQLTASVICMAGIVWCVLSSGGCVRVCEHGGAVAPCDCSNTRVFVCASS